MPFVKRMVVVDGAEQWQRVEGPKAPNKLGQMVSPVAFLEPSGETYHNSSYREGGRAVGVDGRGLEYVSDQRWIYDQDEALALKEQYPDRVTFCEG